MKQTTLTTIILLTAFSVFAQVEPKIKDQIIGSWFFEDKEIDSLMWYHEAHIDSEIIQFYMSYAGFVAFDYSISQDTLFYYKDQDAKYLGFLLMSKKGDTLALKQFNLENEKIRNINFIRLPNHVKSPKNYKGTSKEKNQKFRDDFNMRFEEAKKKDR